MRTPRRSGTRGGFTLIELLAVVAIFALLTTMALPNLGITQSRRVQESARRLAHSLEFTRQRAVMTATPHRVLIDLDAGSYWIERWGASGEPEEPDPLDDTDADLARGRNALVAMSPPGGEDQDFQPIDGPLGSGSDLARGVDFVQIETPNGTFLDGEVEIVFDGDGTTQSSRVTLHSPDVPAVTLLVAPLADTVHLEHEES